MVVRARLLGNRLSIQPFKVKPLKDDLEGLFARLTILGLRVGYPLAHVDAGARPKVGESCPSDLYGSL